MSPKRRVRKRAPFKWRRNSGHWPWEIDDDGRIRCEWPRPESVKECRRLSAWLLKCADWMEQEGKP